MKPEPEDVCENIEWLEKPAGLNGGRMRALVGGVLVAGWVAGDPDAPNVLASIRAEAVAARRG